MRKLARYATVSVIATTVSLLVLGVLVSSRALSPGWANVVATAVGTVPSFELNRRWVWNKDGQRSLHREILPFCVLAFAGLGLSTVAVSATGHWAEQVGLAGAARTATIEAANVAAFGSLWVLQFVVLDRFLFARPVPPVAELELRRPGPSRSLAA